jgi:hypothetical protein
MPLPLTVKTPQDMAFKAAAERYYLIFNLMASGRLAWQRGDFGLATEKWEALLRIPGLDPQLERVIAPLLTDARRRAAAQPGGGTPPPAPPPATPPVVVAPSLPERTSSPEPAASEPVAVRPARPPAVTGTVTGGGEDGPGGAVVWLKRLDGRTPPVAPASGRFITQRKKTFLPHVLIVPVGSTVEFRNDDQIYHNAFSLNKPNDFDAGIRAMGNTFSRKFSQPGQVEILCNIHSNMSAYVIVVDSPYYAKVRESGAFSIPNVPAGQYELSVWYEGASIIARKKISVAAGGTSDISVAIDADKKPRVFVPDKYEHQRQPHLGY